MSSEDTFYLKYKIVEKIGEGSFSIVFKCQHRTTLILHAAKRLKRRYKSESSVITCAEVIAAKKVPSHINVLNMLEYHYDSFSGEVTFIFELMDMSLYDNLMSRNCGDMKGRGLNEQKAKEYLYQLLRGLEHLHKNGLFHRDVKPENILIKFHWNHVKNSARIKNSEVLKLADLGSIRGIYSVPPYTEYISTRWYRSPECLLTSGHYGPKMDIWAIGCVFYEMMTLAPLFPGTCEIDQLTKIHQVVGSPSVQFLSKLKSRSTNCIIFPKTKGSGADKLLPRISQQGKNVLSFMIEYDPDKRTNARRLINNAYFDDIRNKMDSFLDGNLTKQSCRSLENVDRAFTKSSISKTIKSKSLKGSLSSDARQQHSHGSIKNDSKNSSKSHTPSIWIPYYTAPTKFKSNTKISPLINYKIDQQLKKPSVTNTKDNDLLKNSIKRSLEIILRSSGKSTSDGSISSYSQRGSGNFLLNSKKKKRSNIIAKRKISHSDK